MFDMVNVELFDLDYIKVKVFYVCFVGVKIILKGDQIFKYDLCFLQFNQGVIDFVVIYMFEYLLVGYMCDYFEGVVDVFLMGCCIGMYMVVIGEFDEQGVMKVFEVVFKDIVGYD